MAKPKEKPLYPTMWTKYRVRWEFLTRLCGQTPARPDVVKDWLDARKPSARPAGARSIDEINEEVLSTLETATAVAEVEAERSSLVFQRWSGALAMRAATVRAHYKDCARVISQNFTGKVEKGSGERSFATRVINCVYYDPSEYWLPIWRPDGAPIVEPDGTLEKAARAMTRQGPMSFLKQIEYIEPPSVIEFTLLVMSSLPGKQDAVVETDLHYLFQYGGIHGYAGERGDGEGRYSYTLTRIDPA